MAELGSIGSLLSGDGLRAKLLRGGFWLGSGSVLEQLFRFGRNVVLARVLAPEDFGVMTIVLSAGSVINSFTDIGVKEALIQNPQGSEATYVDAAWWLAVGRSITLYTLLFFAAPWLAMFYGNPQLTILLRVAILGLLFDGAFSTRAYVPVKKMKFSRLAAINHGGAAAGVLLTVILGLVLRNVWALVLGACLESIAKCVLSFVLHPFLPTFHWKADAFRSLTRFSRGVFGLSFFNLIFARADVFVLGRLLSAHDLGLYTMAVALVQAPVGFAMNLLGQTLLPAYAEVQNSHQRLNEIFLRTSGVLFAMGLPAVMFLFVCGKSVLGLVYGLPYTTVSSSMLIAGCVGLVNIQNGQPTMIFYAKGKPQLHRAAVLIMALLVAALVYPLSASLGAAGAQVACLAAVALGYSLQLHRLHAMTGFSLLAYGSKATLPAAVATVVFVVFLLGARWPALQRPGISVALGIAGCAVCYAWLLKSSLSGSRSPQRV